MLGERGQLAARLKAETDLRFTQRLILQPELELNAYSRPDRARDQGAGLSEVRPVCACAMRSAASSPRTWAWWRGGEPQGRARS
jgi:uncharacterized protein involved in copper resistance